MQFPRKTELGGVGLDLGGGLRGRGTALHLRHIHFKAAFNYVCFQRGLVYRVVLPAAFAFAHLALAAAASLALTAGLLRRSALLPGFAFFAALPLYLAHLALAAAAMAARPALDILRFFLLVIGPGMPPPPAIASILAWSFSTRLWTRVCSFSIFFLMAMMPWIWSVDKSLICMGELVMPEGFGSQWKNADFQCHLGLRFPEQAPCAGGIMRRGRPGNVPRPGPPRSPNRPL